MIVNKLVAAAIFAIAATGVSTAMANGQARVGQDLTFSAIDGPLAYTTTLAADHSTATIDLVAGRFELGDGTVTVFADDGAVVGAIPTTLRMATGQSVTVAPTLDSSARVLTLTPVSAPAPAPAAAATAPAVLGLHQAATTGSIVAGVAIGCAVGILIGIWFFLVGAVVGCVIGGVIGGFIAAGM
ncbi:hypothetical protein [Nocardia canadensis]|uniref:hypothetical protein n=1 Tax=Nocardia canadensis TaxID=3065238 RepID=UPI00292EA625|nr:hypothetical protein [Nocardia canadensis]